MTSHEGLISSFADQVVSKVYYEVQEFQSSLHLRTRRWRNYMRGEAEIKMSDSGLICVVTGMPRSGTTLLSQLLNSHPRVASGVELGFLLSNVVNIQNISPFFDWLLEQGWGWALMPHDRAKLSKASSFAEMYYLLNKYKGRAHSDDELRQIFEAADKIFDKTPQYISKLKRVMDKIEIPFVVVIKDPREAVSSHLKRSGEMRPFLKKYEKVLREISSAYTEHEERLLLVKYKSLALDTQPVMDRVAEFVGLEGHSDWSMDSYNSRIGRLIKSKNTFSNAEIRYRKPDLLLDKVQAMEFGKFLDRNKERIQLIQSIAV